MIEGILLTSKNIRCMIAINLTYICNHHFNSTHYYIKKLRVYNMFYWFHLRCILNDDFFVARCRVEYYEISIIVNYNVTMARKKVDDYRL